VAPVSLLGALLFFLTYTVPDPETREPRPSLILRYFGGSFDIAEFDDSHLLPQREAVPEARRKNQASQGDILRTIAIGRIPPSACAGGIRPLRIVDRATR
jgi:hypothetical protein